MYKVMRVKKGGGKCVARMGSVEAIYETYEEASAQAGRWNAICLFHHTDFHYTVECK